MSELLVENENKDAEKMTEETVEEGEVINDVEKTVSTAEALDVHIKTIDELLKSVKKELSGLRALRKEINNKDKLCEKLLKKKKSRKSNTLALNNGFLRLENITDDLAAFISDEMPVVVDGIEDEAKKEELSKVIDGIAEKKQISRTSVTKLIAKYITFHKLQDPEHPKNILLDSEKGKALKGILSPIVDESGNKTLLTYALIQRFIKHNYKGPAEVSVEKEVKVEEKKEEVPVVEEKKVPLEEPDVPKVVKKTVVKKKKIVRKAVKV